MNIVIVEDEQLAAARLQAIVEKNEAGSKLVKKMDSVESSVKWFRDNNAYDLVFMDIQLADGLCFEIFDQVQISSPIIFTTAFDEYAIKAFKVNSIDYVLKPYDESDIVNALKKFHQTQPKAFDMKLMEQWIKNFEKNYKNRFVIKIGEHLKFITTEEISHFYSQEKSSFAQLQTGKSYAMDYSLDELENMLDPKLFFRINRKYIVSLQSIVDIIAFTNSRLKLKLKQIMEDDVIVSREKVVDFKKWLEG